MRAGKVMGTMPTAGSTREGLARMMVGREVLLSVDKPPQSRGEPVLQVRDLSYVAPTGRTVLRDVSFNVYAGEILGVAGVEGNGQSELVEVLSGLQPATTGEARIDAREILRDDPRSVRMSGVAHIPEDRLTNGLALQAKLDENLIVDRYFRHPYRKGLSIDLEAVADLSTQLIHDFDIRTPNAQVPVASLSGGNMQKVILARELSSDPAVLIAAQPTRGIDVGATEFVRQQLVRQRTRGTAVLLVSADLAEVMTISDRIIVMYEGRITGVFPDAASVTEEELGLYMLGLRRQEPEFMEAHL
jgi:simple sugar transport system ATP-binding protein